VIHRFVAYEGFPWCGALGLGVLNYVGCTVGGASPLAERDSSRGPQQRRGWSGGLPAQTGEF
jgi:hypothetical protein